jgi:hypothetical protein
MAGISDIMKVMLMFDSSAMWDDMKSSPLWNTDVRQLTTTLALSLIPSPFFDFSGSARCGFDASVTSFLACRVRSEKIKVRVGVKGQCKTQGGVGDSTSALHGTKTLSSSPNATCV